MTGEIEDKGRFPGAMKLAGDAMYPIALEVPGMEKSFISLFIMRPVSGTITPEPKLRFIVLVRDIASPLASAVTV